MTDKTSAQQRWHRRAFQTVGTSMQQMTIPLALCGYFLVRGAWAVFLEALPIVQSAIQHTQDVVQQVPSRIIGG